MIYAADNPFIYIPEPAPDPLSPETTFIASPEYWVILLVNVLFIAVMSLGLVSLIVAGIKYMSSKGDVKATQAAKTQLTYSIVAIVGGVAAVTATVLILNVLGIDAPGQSISNYLGL